MKYGYVRDSFSDERQLDRQKEIIGKVDIVIEDTDKSKLRELMVNIQAGDSIHISDMSRVTRKIEECKKLYAYLLSKGAKLYVNGIEYKPLSDFMENIMKVINKEVS